jgi:UMF1 family MFS transporter
MKNKFTKLEKSWILYDVGNSAFILMVTTLIPIIFKANALNNGIDSSTSTAYWGYALTISTIIVAILGPTLGRLADEKDRKKKFFTTFLLMGVVACALLGFISNWLGFLLVFVVAKVGFSTTNVFYDSMLTDITTDEKSDNVSSNGFAWGYIGSCIPFILVIALSLLHDKIGISTTGSNIISFIFIAIWWFTCATPLLRSYKQTHYIVREKKDSFFSVFKGLGETFTKIRKDKPMFYFLIAFFLYIDAVQTIITMSAAYGSDVGIDSTQMLLALLLTQIIAFPAAIVFGKLSMKFETKRLIKIDIIGYCCIVLFAVQLDQAWEFWALAVAVALFQGSIQALSRSYFSRLVPKENSNEYFGIFGILGKGAAALGTFMMAFVTQVTGSSRIGVFALLILLVLGFIMMIKIPESDADLKKAI